LTVCQEKMLQTRSEDQKLEHPGTGQHKKFWTDVRLWVNSVKGNWTVLPTKASSNQKKVLEHQVDNLLRSVNLERSSSIKIRTELFSIMARSYPNWTAKYFSPSPMRSEQLRSVFRSILNFTTQKHFPAIQTDRLSNEWLEHNLDTQKQSLGQIGIEQLRVQLSFLSVKSEFRMIYHLKYPRVISNTNGTAQQVPSVKCGSSNPKRTPQNVLPIESKPKRNSDDFQQSKLNGSDIVA